MTEKKVGDLVTALPDKFIMPGSSGPSREEPDLVFVQDEKLPYCYTAEIPEQWNGSQRSGEIEIREEVASEKRPEDS